ncbi:toll-like receptor 13 [Pholidichthys leucotaenia]
MEAEEKNNGAVGSWAVKGMAGAFSVAAGQIVSVSSSQPLLVSWKPIIDNITDAIYGSRKTICVISRKYLESEWCSREIQAASFRLFDEKKDVLILVFLEDIPTFLLSPFHRMRKMLKKKTYLSWPRATEHPEVFWEKLRQALNTGEDLNQERLQLTVPDTL